MTSLRSIAIVLAGRETIANRFKHKFQSYMVNNLSPDGIRTVFQQLVNDNDKGELLLDYISKPDGLVDFLATPYFAIKAAQFWNSPGDKEFNLGRLLFALLDRFIIRQGKREEIGFEEEILYERAETLEQIALECMLTESPLTVEHRRRAKDSWEWYKLMEFINSSSIAPSFTNKWVHGFFAAHYVTRTNHFSPQERYELVKAYITPFTALKAAFLQLLQDLVHEDYSELIPDEVDFTKIYTEDEIDWYTWGFEQKIRSFYEEELGFRVTHSYCPPYLGREIDIYAEKEQGRKTTIETVECKFRFPPYPKPAELDYLEQLYETWQAVNEEMHKVIERQGGSVKVIPTLITNGGDYSEDFINHARERKICVYDVHLPINKYTTRSKINRQQVKKIV